MYTSGEVKTIEMFNVFFKDNINYVLKEILKVTSVSIYAFLL